jgi:hypothetical protein
MKKLLIVLAIGAFAACNSGSSTTSTDSTATSTDTSTMSAPVDTSMSSGDTSHMMMSDTTHKDSTQK